MINRRTAVAADLAPGALVCRIEEFPTTAVERAPPNRKTPLARPASVTMVKRHNASAPHYLSHR